MAILDSRERSAAWPCGASPTCLRRFEPARPPLLTGERAHYELAAGRMAVAEDLAQAMEMMAGDAGLLPEQLWDSADIPDRELFLGQP